MIKSIFSKVIIILMSITIVSFSLFISCTNTHPKPKSKLSKTEDRLLYIMINKYSADGHKSIGVNDTIALKPKENQSTIEDINRIFNNKNSINSDALESAQYRIIFLYNLNPDQSNVSEEFMKSDRFEISYKSDFLVIQNEETKETFKIEGDDYKKLSQLLQGLNGNIFN